jgi:hypothetical protein
MTAEDLKRYSVRVGEGSGCFFQPMTNEYTYILTAKHLFSALQNGAEIDIFRHLKNEDGWSEELIPFTLELGVNYFPHPQADASILKIDYLDGFKELFVKNEINENVGYQLCGFPSQNRDSAEGERYSPYRVERILASGNYCHMAQLFGTVNYDNVAGMSGGGFLKIETDHLSILGIQSRMATNAVQALGQIGFIPIKYYNQIIDANENAGALEKLLPAYLKSFSFFEDEIFSIITGPQEVIVSRRDKLTELLKVKASEIRDSDITPNYIKEHLSNRLLLLEQTNFDLQKRGIWRMWLEFLTILNIAKNKAHSLADMPVVFEKVRIFFSDIHQDFWTAHLMDLPKLDYSGLGPDGIVIVASNIPSVDREMEILDLSKITSNIAEARKKYAQTHLGHDIDVASEFPLEKYKFINISAFKERVVTELDEDFDNSLPNESLATLKRLYERFIPEW